MFAADRILTLDIGASKLVIGEFTANRAGELELQNYGASPIGFDPESTAEASAYVVAALRDLMREHGIKPGPVHLSISGQMVIPKFTKLPPVARDKIGQVVLFEAQNNVPFPIKEVVWDYQLIGEEDGQLSVMIVAVKEELVRKMTDCVIAAGLDPEIVDVSPLALFNTVRYNYSELEGCTMILDIGARSSNMIFVEGNRIFMRNITVAGNAITRDLMKEFGLSFEDAEKLKLAHAFVGFGGTFEGGDGGVSERASKVVRNVMTRLHAEVSRTINFYRSQQSGSQPSLVLLAGGSSIIPHANTFLKDKLKMEVDYLNPFLNVAVNPRVATERIGEQAHLLGEVVGVALRRVHTCPVEIDLMPHDLVSRKTYERRLPYFSLSGLGVILILLVWWGYFHRVWNTSKVRYQKVHDETSKREEFNAALEQALAQEDVVLRKAATLADLVRERTRWMEIVEMLHQQAPDGLWFTGVHPVPVKGPEPVKSLAISGMAFSDKVKIESVTEFATSLVAQGYFSEVQVRRVRPQMGKDYVNEFQMEAQLKAFGTNGVAQP